jgi:hypothetical protein
MSAASRSAKRASGSALYRSTPRTTAMASGRRVAARGSSRSTSALGVRALARVATALSGVATTSSTPRARPVTGRSMGEAREDASPRIGQFQPQPGVGGAAVGVHGERNGRLSTGGERT